MVEKLSVLSGIHLTEKQWQTLNRQKTIADASDIDRKRFEHKRQKVPAYTTLLKSIRQSKSHPLYSRTVLLHKVHQFYQLPFYQSRLALPSLSKKTQLQLVNDLLEKEDPQKVHIVHISYRQKPFIICLFRTPSRVSPSRLYPAHTLLKVVIHEGNIQEVEQLTTSVH